MRRLFTPLRLTLLGGLIFLAALPVWCSRAPIPVVHAARAARAPLQMKVATNGEVEPLDEAELIVRARLDGRVLLLPDPGTHVAAGEQVLRIDDAPVGAELAKVRSERLAAVEALRTARHELAVLSDRFATDKSLYDQKALTRERYAESEAALRDAEARVAALERESPLRVTSLELNIADLEAKLKSTTVVAPFAATIYRTSVKKGELVREGDAIVWMADLQRLRVRANVDQADLGRVAAGQRVVIGTNAFPNRNWSGQITEVVPHVVVKENRSISEALARLDPPSEGLVPGMRVDVEVIVAENADALQIPAESVLTNGKKPFVYRLDGRHLRKTPVDVGLSSVTSVEIRSGLGENDLVVVGPMQGLTDGEKVKIQKPIGEAPGTPNEDQ